MRRAVFLDRDGILNRSIVRDGKPYPPNRAEELEILPRVPEALAALRAAGFLNIVVTNQPDVATGKTPRAFVDWIHDQLRTRLAIDDIFACYCVEGPGCPCYKPSPCMLVEAARKWSIDLAASAMVGDRWRDIGAGRAAGCKTFFVDHGYAEALKFAPDVVVADLADASGLIIAGGRSN